MMNASSKKEDKKEMMSGSSSEKVDKDGQVNKALEPKWLEAFLSKTFFDSCSTHPFYKNELNKYCINCNMPACQYCASYGTHRKHKTLKIYRLSFKDTIPLASLEKYFDCSKVQPYKCNRHLVVALKPLPHTGTAKWNRASSCDICSRKLAEPDLYRYCSISCKVEAISRKPNEETTKPQKQLNKGNNEETTKSRKRLNMERKEETTESPKRKNRRKGTPHRAPFF